MTQKSNITVSKDSTLSKPAPAGSCVLVIFGIAGDLTKRLLFPAICNLGAAGMLDKDFHIVGFAKETYDDESFRAQLVQNINEFITDPPAKQYGLQLAKKVSYISGDFADGNSYQILKNKLAQLAKQGISKSCLFYFAAPPQFMATIATQLNKAELLTQEKGKYFRRIVVEKPFGHNLDSAKKLNQLLLSFVEEDQIFRIDHFLGKETVQNILALRFSNGFLEPLWNRLHIDHVQITVSEKLGVEKRGGYYEGAGALRDMVANHLFQLLSLIAMEPPASFFSENIQAEKLKAMASVGIMTPKQVQECTVRGQYDAGKLDGANVPAYRAEANVKKNSATETFAALKLAINNWRWLDVPFYLRTGKRMPVRHSEIIVQFKTGPSTLFHGADKNIVPTPNLLRISIQPDEGVSLCFNSKIPGPCTNLEPVEMKFKYSDYFGVKAQTGYETIIYDCLVNEHLLFTKAEMVETQWTILQPILDTWGTTVPKNFPNYSAGTWGPKEADDLLLKDNRKWIVP